MGFVCDASVALTWVFSDKHTAATTALQDQAEAGGMVVPSLWFLELANILGRAQSKRKLPAASIDEFLEVLTAYEIEVDDDWAGRAFQEIRKVAMVHGLTAYNATYLDLAVRRRLPLATLDADLRRAATAAEVELLGE